jgi:hypothetical protein
VVRLAPRRGASAIALDLTGAPRVRERLERVRWELVDEATAAQRRDEGPGVLRLEPRRDGDARISWERADGSVRAVDAAVWELWALALGPCPDESDDWERRQAEVAPVADRVVHALTDGALSLRDVDLAQWAAGLQAPLLHHEEAVLVEIAARAEGQRAEAEALVERLGAATDGDVEAAPYGVVRRVVAPAFEVPTSAEPLLVPEAVSWVVEGVADWEPVAAAARREARFQAWRSNLQAAKQAGKRRERRVWLAIGVLLAIGLAVGALGWLASS